MLITGRVREISPGEMTVATLAWSLRAIPLMAAVHLPEDPARRARGVYNTASWRKQTMITLAGPAANIALLVAAVAAMAAIPVTAVYAPIMTVRTVAQGSPAELAGLRPGDHVIQVDNMLVPDREELQRAIFKAMVSGKPMRMQLKRGEETVMAEIYPDQVTGRIGVTLAAYTHPPRRHSMKPGDVGSRFASLGMVYFRTAKTMIDQFGKRAPPRRYRAPSPQPTTRPRPSSTPGSGHGWRSWRRSPWAQPSSTSSRCPRWTDTGWSSRASRPPGGARR